MIITSNKVAPDAEVVRYGGATFRYNPTTGYYVPEGRAVSNATPLDTRPPSLGALAAVALYVLAGIGLWAVIGWCL